MEVSEWWAGARVGLKVGRVAVGRRRCPPAVSSLLRLPPAPLASAGNASNRCQQHGVHPREGREDAAQLALSPPRRRHRQATTVSSMLMHLRKGREDVVQLVLGDADAGVGHRHRHGAAVARHRGVHPDLALRG